MKSFKDMIKAGEVKRADAMKVALDDIHEQPGFNLRIEGEDLEASIEALATHIMDGGTYPPLEVRVREEGGVWVVDGHRRRRALVLARERGAPIEFVSIIAFNGNDAERTVRVMTSAEGRGLSPLEAAMGYKRLAAFDYTPDQIAKAVGKTRQHVDQLLILANAPAKVQKMVQAGEISAAAAVDVARKHGDEAGKVLEGEMDKAKAAGKKKITAGTIKGKPLPPKVITRVVEELDGFLEGLDAESHRKLAEVKSGSVAQATVAVDAKTLNALVDAYQEIVDARAEQKRRAKAKADRKKQADLEEK
jgi:ParB family chromosome partitioning protein